MPCASSSGLRVLALNILDQSHRRYGLIIDILDQHRYGIESGHLHGAETSLTGNDFKFLRTVLFFRIGRTSIGCSNP